jgi:redox-sensitive bicupin YhaK (pirin superfamily)
MPERGVERVLRGFDTTDGAGVRLHRVFGPETARYTDPFLLLDEIKSRNPEEYVAGFPPHPHRGMEVITYMLSGFFRHEDSLGNMGMLGPGGLLWVTAGSGIVHEETPLESSFLQGFQLWINLPGSEKMCPPACRNFRPRVYPPSPGSRGGENPIGSLRGENRSCSEAFRDLLLLDIRLDPDSLFHMETSSDRTVFLYAFQGGWSDSRHAYAASCGQDAFLLSSGQAVECGSGKEALDSPGIRRPFGNPWRGRDPSS